MRNEEFKTQVFGEDTPKTSTETTSGKPKRPPLLLLILLLLAIGAGGVYVYKKIQPSNGGKGEGIGTTIVKPKVPQPSVPPNNPSPEPGETPGAGPQPSGPSPGSRTETTPPTPPTPPKISIVLPPEINATEPAAFRSSSDVANLRWDFGGEGSGSGPEVSHTFRQSGKYTVVVSTPEFGELARREILVSVGNKMLGNVLGAFSTAIENNKEAVINSKETDVRSLFEQAAVVEYYNKATKQIVQDKRLDAFIDAYILDVDDGKKPYSDIRRITVDNATGKIRKLELYE